MDTLSKLQVPAGTVLVTMNVPEGLELPASPAGADDDPAGRRAFLVFVSASTDMGTAEADAVIAAALRDDIAWFAYPKGKQLGTDLNRDTLARMLQARGARPVRQVSIDDVWSALRARPA